MNWTGLHKASTSSNIFGENRNANCEPSLIAQHQCPNLTKALEAELDQIPASGFQNLLGSLSKRESLKAQTYCKYQDFAVRCVFMLFWPFGGIFENHREQEIIYRITKTWRMRKRKRREVSDKEGR